MAGIYIHVPFCRKACRYCDFYFTVSLRFREAFVRGVLKEIRSRKDFFGKQPVSTIYFGGGTPSVLEPDQLEQIITTVHETFTVAEGPEQTLEANPDDLESETLENLKGLSFNRLSIGIQSFHQRDLELMNRSHDAAQAERSVLAARDCGFENLNLDLIYGVPGLTTGGWRENLEKAVSLPIDHLSAYHLTFEEGTVFELWRKKGRLHEMTEQESVRQYEILREVTTEAGFDHYEISNFARDGKYAIHNRSYWTGEPYLGVGPAAHSFDGHKRYWNVASLKKYLHAVEHNLTSFESETPDPQEQYHDYIITMMRTSSGTDPDYVQRVFPGEISDHYMRVTRELMGSGQLEKCDQKVKIPAAQWLLADGIIRKMMR